MLVHHRVIKQKGERSSMAEQISIEGFHAHDTYQEPRQRFEKARDCVSKGFSNVKVYAHVRHVVRPGASLSYTKVIRMSHLPNTTYNIHTAQYWYNKAVVIQYFFSLSQKETYSAVPLSSTAANATEPSHLDKAPGPV